MNLTIIGAGVAGLSAARRLRALRPEIDCTIYEKSRGYGGRAATRRRDGFVFDHGAQYFKTPSPATRDLISRELPRDDLLAIGRDVWVFDRAGQLVPGDAEQNAEPKWTYRSGLSTLGKLLAEGSNVRRETRVAALRRVATGGWQIIDEHGAHVGDADAVLLTAPAPQSAQILAASAFDAGLRDVLIAALEAGQYHRCLSLALAYNHPLERPWYAAVNTDRQHPISWVALEAAKDAGRVPPGHSLLIAQMAAGYSAGHWETDPAALAAHVADLLSSLLGEDLHAPLWADRQGWRYALVDQGVDRAALANDAGLYFAGDFTAGQARVHLAIEEGLRVAAAIAAFQPHG